MRDVEGDKFSSKFYGGGAKLHWWFSLKKAPGPQVKPAQVSITEVLSGSGGHWSIDLGHVGVEN